MRKLIIGLVGLSALSLVAAVPMALHSEPVVLTAVTLPSAQPATLTEIAAASVPSEHITQEIKDPWFLPLRELAEQLSDAYLDKPHVTRLGMSSGEKPLGRQMRLDGFTTDVLTAVRARAGELAQFGPDAAWGYAATLMWIAHRETRIASDPSKLGNQDDGRAAGPWQIWKQSGHPMDRFQASSALDLLIRESSSSWSLPKWHPWIGYPECARWVATHPAP